MLIKKKFNSRRIVSVGQDCISRTTMAFRKTGSITITSIQKSSFAWLIIILAIMILSFNIYKTYNYQSNYQSNNSQLSKAINGNDPEAPLENIQKDNVQEIATANVTIVSNATSTTNNSISNISAQSPIIINQSIGSDRYIPSEKINTLFESGRGISASNKMNYQDYESSIFFTPLYDMAINIIEPKVYLCEDICYLKTEVYNEQSTNLLGEYYAEVTSPKGFTGILNHEVILKEGSKYRIKQHVWSNKSVGIYTAGMYDVKTNLAEYEVVSARSLFNNDSKNKGPIAFKIKGYLTDTSTFNAASWDCILNKVGKNDIVQKYSFDSFRQEFKCRSKEEWRYFSNYLCESLCEPGDMSCTAQANNLVVEREC